jgi:hypothetical protein
LEENVGGVEEPYVTWTDEEDTVIWEMDCYQCSQNEPDGEEDAAARNVICPEEEDTILLDSSKITNCLPRVGGSLRLPPPLKLVAMI